jgi:hypothetical protein
MQIFPLRTKAPMVHESLFRGADMPALYNGVKVFSATKAREREMLGERITEWIESMGKIEIVDTTVTQSSDREFHCLTVTIFYRNP